VFAHELGVRVGIARERSVQRRPGRRQGRYAVLQRLRMSAARRMPGYTGRGPQVPSVWSKMPTLNLCLSVYSPLTRNAGGFEMADDDSSYDSFPDLGALSDEELKGLIQQHTEQEQEVSYKRRILHGKIDILRAELVNRLRKKHQDGESAITGADVQQLTDILSGKSVPNADVN
jgi:hypothetical protein